MDLRKLLENFIDPSTHELKNIYYFSAYASWKPNSVARHRAYIKALSNSGITPILGGFKEKDRYCRVCTSSWKTHEEKESDVNLALCLLNEAYKDTYDLGFVVSQDSDLAPPVRMVLEEFPNKRIKIISPPNLRHSKELAQAVRSHKKDLANIKEIHMERSLLPKRVLDAGGNLVATRPSVYDLPT